MLVYCQIQTTIDRTDETEYNISYQYYGKGSRYVILIYFVRSYIMQITNNEKQILKCFLALNIPAYIKMGSKYELDLMLCHEDLCNQIYNVLHGFPINIEVDSWNSGDALIFDGRYERILMDIVEETIEIELRAYCSLAITVLQVIKEYHSRSN